MLQVDRFLEVTTPPDLTTGGQLTSIAVLGGDFHSDELTAALGEPDDGSWIAGSLWLSLPDNDHLTITRDAETSAAVAVVISGDATDGPVLADDPALGDLAAALDRQGAYAAGIYRPGPGLGAISPPAGAPNAGQAFCEQGLSERPAAVAVGITDDDGPVVLVALAHDSDTAAESNATALDHIVTQGASLVSGEPWSRSLTLDRIEVTGDNSTVVLARLRPVEPRPRIWYDLLTRRENLISSC